MQYVDGYPVADRRTSAAILAVVAWLDAAAAQCAAAGDQVQADDLRRQACQLRNYVHPDAQVATII